jgi:hypothetical protein
MGVNYWNDLPLKEKQRLVREALLPITKHKIAQNHPEQKNVSHSGSQEATDYPKMPSGSPWSSDYAPAWKPEESLGFSVDDVPVCAEPHEVKRAAQILASRSEPVPASTEALAGTDEAEGAIGCAPSANPSAEVSPVSSAAVPTSRSNTAFSSADVGTNPNPPVHRRRIV